MTRKARKLGPHVESAPGRCGGTPVVIGTRVPTASLWPWWGDDPDKVVEQYPPLTREQAIAAMSFEAGTRYALRNMIARIRGVHSIGELIASMEELRETYDLDRDG